MGNNPSKNKRSTDKQLAKLALLGEAIGLFGQAITTLATYLALEAEEDEDDSTAQIDYLLEKIGTVEKL